MGKEITEAYVALRLITDGIAPDVDAAAGGNKAAGTRVRVAMQRAKEACQQLREAIQVAKAKAV